jgi:hypothetical protein
MKIKLPMKLFINANIIFPQKSYKLNDKVKKVKKVEKSNLHVMTKYLNEVVFSVFLYARDTGVYSRY